MKLPYHSALLPIKSFPLYTSFLHNAHPFSQLSPLFLHNSVPSPWIIHTAVQLTTLLYIGCTFKLKAFSNIVLFVTTFFYKNTCQQAQKIDIRHDFGRIKRMGTWVNGKEKGGRLHSLTKGKNQLLLAKSYIILFASCIIGIQKFLLVDSPKCHMKFFFLLLIIREISTLMKCIKLHKFWNTFLKIAFWYLPTHIRWSEKYS